MKDSTSSKEIAEEGGTGNHVDNKTKETSGYQKGGQSGDSVDTEQEDRIIDNNPNKNSGQICVSYDYSLLFLWGHMSLGILSESKTSTILMPHPPFDRHVERMV
jgi:hypothetical protein